jgi:hypothetical protein
MDQPREPNPAANDHNRRISDRFNCDLPTHCHPIGFPEGSRLRVRLRNISRAGANLTLDRSLPPGTILRLELPGNGSAAGRDLVPDGHADIADIENLEEPSPLAATFTSSTVLACVVHAVRQPSGEWQLGCTFVNQLRDDDLIPFGARLERPSGPEQRRWVRFPCNFDIHYRIIKVAEGEAQTALVLDISVSGIGLAAPEPVAGGTLLSLELPMPPGGAPFRMLACVVRTGQQQDGRWMLGCNFIRQLQENELKQVLDREAVGSGSKG